MILNELIQRIQSLYSKGVQSDDSRLKARHIYNKITTVRAKLLSQRKNKKQASSQWNYQTICIPVKKASVSECKGIPKGICEIYRSKEPIPNIITSMRGHLIQSVTSLDGSILFSEIKWSEKKYKSAAKYTANSPDYFIRDDYMYFTSPKPPKVITLTALFEDPVLANTYGDCCEDCEDCDSPLDLEFPIDRNLIEPLVDMAALELIEKFNRNQEDLRPDTKDNTAEQTK